MVFGSDELFAPWASAQQTPTCLVFCSESMSGLLKARDAVLVRFRSDPQLWHHKLTLSEPYNYDCAQYVLTPDRRVKSMTFGAATLQEILLYSGDLSPDAEDCCRDVDSTHGPFMKAEIRAAR